MATGETALKFLLTLINRSFVPFIITIFLVGGFDIIRFFYNPNWFDKITTADFCFFLFVFSTIAIFKEWIDYRKRKNTVYEFRLIEGKDLLPPLDKY